MLKMSNNKNTTDSTILISDIHEALNTSENEAIDKPAALLAIGGDLNGTLFDIKPLTTIGRNADNTIILEFNGISRKHIKITEDDNDSHIIEDMGSKNGTFINNQKINKKKLLNKGDIIKLGSITLKYLPKGDTERLTYEKLNMDANTDKHTGCFNKIYFLNELDREVKKSKITGNPLSLIIFDLDHFKSINDNHGHATGDYVIKTTAEIIRKNSLRENDIFARYGGEEFVILLPKTTIKQAFEIAERMRIVIEKNNFTYEKNNINVTISIGISDYRQGVINGEELLKRADIAVYKSKDKGRNQTNFFKE